MGLNDRHRSGRPQKWIEADFAYVEKQLSSEAKTFNTRQIRELLGQERQVHLTQRQISRVMKKRGIGGRGQEPVKRKNKTKSSRSSSRQI